MCIAVLRTCMSVHYCVKYVCEMPTDARQEVAQDPIGLELQTFLSCCVHAGN